MKHLKSNTFQIGGAALISRPALPAAQGTFRFIVAGFSLGRETGNNEDVTNALPKDKTGFEVRSRHCW
jgi:hypothetical protein